jgi:hypothetical protein
MDPAFARVTKAQREKFARLVERPKSTDAPAAGISEKQRVSRHFRANSFPKRIGYRINRQLSGWNLPPLVIRAFGAHCHQRTLIA